MGESIRTICQYYKKKKKVRDHQGPQGVSAKHHYTEQRREGEVGKLGKWNGVLY